LIFASLPVICSGLKLTLSAFLLVYLLIGCIGRLALLTVQCVKQGFRRCLNEIQVRIFKKNEETQVPLDNGSNLHVSGH